MTQTLRALSRLVGVLGVFAAGGRAGADPQRDLHKDLEQLNVRHTTAHYELAGTVSDAEIEHFGLVLEYIYREYSRGFSGLLDRPDAAAPGAPETRFKVVVLARESQYEEFTRAYFRERAEHTTGLYVSAAELLIIRADGEADETHGVLFHEAFHQFAHRHVPAMPTWLNEGLGTYYGTARATRDGLVFDRPRDDLARLIGEASRLKLLVPLRTLMEATAEEFYDAAPVRGLEVTHRTLRYAQSYTLVSYMLQDEGGRRHLQEYLRKLARAASPDEAKAVTFAAFPDDLSDAMVEPWLAHARRFAAARR